MKKKYVYIIISMMIISNMTHSQTHLLPLHKIDTLHVSDIRTTHLMFDKDIEYLDIGSPYFVADTVTQMIKLKHTGKGLNEQKATMSNLTVITEDGEFYSMVLYYDRFVKLFNYYVKDSKDFVPYYKDKIMQKHKESDNYSLLCDRIQGFDSNIMLRNSRNQDLKIKITGVYYIDNKIGVRIEIINRSSIDFDIDQILFRNKLKKKIISPDYLYQERVVMPVYICTNNMEVPGNEKRIITLLFNKFTPNKRERLYIDVFEINGGRSASFYIPRKVLMNPKIVN